MKKIIVSILVVFALLSGGAWAADPLADLVDKKRPLLLFSKSRSDAGLDKQVELLRQVRPELRELGIIVLRTSGREETRSVIGYTPINIGTARKLRKRFEPSDDGLVVILLSMDGSEKKRWDGLVQPEEIFDFIEASSKGDE